MSAALNSVPVKCVVSVYVKFRSILNFPLFLIIFVLFRNKMPACAYEALGLILRIIF
jgi:hypothetical protein